MPINFVLLLSSVLFVSLKGSRVLVTLFAVDLGASALQVSILFALHGLFPLLLAISAGRIADRYDNRILIYCGLAVTRRASRCRIFFLPSPRCTFRSRSAG